MKKILFFAVALSVGVMTASCGGDKKTAEGEAAAAASAEVDPEAEEAVKAYEAYLVKYEDIMKRSAAGEDVTEESLNLMDESLAVSEKLIATERKRNDEQKARVKEIEHKVDSIKKIALQM